MKRIYKHKIKITDEQFLPYPTDNIIHAGLDPLGQPCVWFEVFEPVQMATEPNTGIRIFVVGTGNPMPEKATRHIGSFVMSPFVWHVYIEG